MPAPAVYQVYPRSFQDSDGDGVGDLPGVERRLGHLEDLGVDALWLSPIYPSPLADLGYDISDFTAVDPALGGMEAFDSLLAAAHGRGLAVLLDLVPCHTSVAHPWFESRPDFYVWAEGREGGPPNNWVSAFGGPAWTYVPARGRWYLHSFYPEQADLDWRNPAVVAAMSDVIRFWVQRGVDGFRVDAIDRLLKDPELRDDPPASRPFALPAEGGDRLELNNSRNGPGIGAALAAIREAAGDRFLVGEVYLPSDRQPPYLEQLDAVFSFELFHAPWEAAALRRAIEGAIALATPAGRGAAWVVSNHDFARVATRWGAANARAAMTLLLTLPGPAFIYQGEEIGQVDGPGADPPRDRAGRDAHRYPVQWQPGPGGGFSSTTPWLAPVDPGERSVAAQTGDAGSLLELTRGLLALRRRLGPEIELLDAPEGVLAYARGGGHEIAINTTGRPRPFGDVRLAPHEARVLGDRPSRCG